MGTIPANTRIYPQLQNFGFFSASHLAPPGGPFSALVLNHLGGADNASELQRMQARRIAALEAELIHIEDRIARAHAAGEEPAVADLDLYGRLANGQRRHCEVLGWDRTARDITPTTIRERILAAREVTAG